MKSYNDFVALYEDGLTIMDIVDRGDISRRTAYRYKAYYDGLKKMNGIVEEDKKENNVVMINDIIFRGKIQCFFMWQ